MIQNYKLTSRDHQQREKWVKLTLTYVQTKEWLLTSTQLLFTWHIGYYIGVAIVYY